MGRLEEDKRMDERKGDRTEAGARRYLSTMNLAK
jgi:hypothetical protein